MAEKVRSQIMLDIDNYQWLTEERVGRHHKNLSVTINEIIKNYQIMLKSVDRAREHAERQAKARLEAEQLAQNYRTQVIEK